MSTRIFNNVPATVVAADLVVAALFIAAIVILVR